MSRTSDAEGWAAMLHRDLRDGKIPNTPMGIAYVSAGHIDDLLSYIKELKIELEVLRAAKEPQ